MEVATLYDGFAASSNSFLLEFSSDLAPGDTAGGSVAVDWRGFYLVATA